MKRTAIISLSLLVIVALAASGWWYAQREAAKEVRRAMIDADLFGRIKYEGVTYNPLTSAVTIRDIRPIGDEIPGNVRADALQITDWAKEDDLLTRVHIRLVNLRLDVLEAARKEGTVLTVSFGDSPFKLLQYPLQSLVMLGYPDLVADAEIDSRYDPDEAVAKFVISLKAHRMGEVQFNVALAGVTLNLIRALAELGKQTSEGPAAIVTALAFFSGQKKEVEKIGLADFGLSFQEAGLVRRLKEYYDIQTLRLPGQPSALDLTEKDVEQAVVVGGWFGLPEDMVRSSARAVAQFCETPDRLRIRTKIDDPVRLSRIAAAADDTRGITRSIMLTNLEITN